MRLDVKVRNVNGQKLTDKMMLLNRDAIMRHGRGGGGGRGRGGHRGDVRNNTTMKINCISPELRLGDQNRSHFEVDSPDLAARAVAAF